MVVRNKRGQMGMPRPNNSMAMDTPSGPNTTLIVIIGVVLVIGIVVASFFLFKGFSSSTEDDDTDPDGGDNDDSQVCGDETLECEDGTVVSLELSDSGNCVFVCPDNDPDSDPEPTCGDGTVDSGEQCDDGNTQNGDGCDSTCQNEPQLLCNDPLLDEILLEQDGDDSITVTADIEDGEVTFNLFYANTTSGTFEGMGKSAEQTLATSPTSTLSADQDIHDWIVVSHGNTTTNSYETYVLSITEISTANATTNRTTLTSVVSGSTIEASMDIGETASIGSAAVTLISADATTGEIVLESANTGTLFNALVTTSKVLLSLPFGCDAQSNAPCYFTPGDATVDVPLANVSNASAFPLILTIQLDVNDSEIVIYDDSGQQCDNTAAPVCGNDIIETGEECDDGNTIDGDGCSAICEDEPLCGDGTLDTGEECDDGNTIDGDGCSAICEDEPAECGNDIIEGDEQCDDGNLIDGDGCSAICEDEPVLCGDGIEAGDEQCDDGNLVNGDGCSDVCMIEPILVTSTPDCYARGDTDGDGDLDFDDVAFIVAAYGGGPVTDPVDIMDIDNNGVLGINDGPRLANYINDPSNTDLAPVPADYCGQIISN